MNHAFFIMAAYGASLLVLGGLVAWILGDQAARKRELADLEARGVRRRSAGAADKP